MSLKHISREQYSLNVSNIKPNLSVHPEVVVPPTNAENYLLPAVFILEKGNPIIGKYVGPVVVYVIEGELQYEYTSKPGNLTVIGAGDVVHIAPGADIIWNSPSKGKGFAVLYAPASVKGPEDLVS